MDQTENLLNNFRNNKLIKDISDFYSIDLKKVDCLFAKIFDMGIFNNTLIDNRTFNLFKRSIWPFLMKDKGAIKNVSIILLETKTKSVFLGSLVTTNPKTIERIMFFPAINKLANQNVKNIQKGFHITIDHNKIGINNIHLTGQDNSHEKVMKSGFDDNKPLFTAHFNYIDYEECHRFIPIVKTGTQNAQKRFYDVLNEDIVEIIKIPYPYEDENVFLNLYFKKNIEDKSLVIYGVDKKEDIKEKFKSIIHLKNQNFFASVYSLEKCNNLKTSLFFQNDYTYCI